MEPRETIIFPPFSLNVASQEIHRGESLIELRPKTVAVLQYLLEHAGHVVTKDDLLDSVWPETAVSDTVLKVCIREIRDALEDDAAAPRFIETLHRKGYRFIGEIRTSNLPASLTSFIGREREISEVKRLLDGDARLLTLTGAGGSGKTRLAARVANGLIDENRDGVWWVDLAPLNEESLVPQALIAVLAIHEQPGKTPVQTLCDYLKPRRLTLVLDNCEHLIQATAMLAETLLHVCPHLRIVATSRENLGVEGEIEFPVPPMSVPDSHRELTRDELHNSEAVRLFLDRAKAVAPQFALTDRNAKTIAEVCRRLDGIPLAIELAAARLKVLTVEQVLARLDDCFRLLITAGRSQLPRHQTLRATIDWSYDLLNKEERALLRRVSVFAGGWTLEAVEEICAGDGIDRIEVLDLLSHLVDKSLVLMTDAGGEARYRLLETIRQYASGKLIEANESESVVQRHVDYFLRFAETIAPRINTSDRPHWLLVLGSEHDNIRAALRCAAERGDTETELRLCEALFFFWFYRGYWTEGRAWIRDALERSAGEGGTELRGRAMKSDGMLASFIGDHAAARQRLEESASIHRKTGNQLSLSGALVFLGYELLESDHVRARAVIEEGISILRHTNEKFVLAMSLNHLGAVVFVEKDYAAAQSCYAEAASIARELNDNLAIGSALRGLGAVAVRQGQYDLAASHLKESLVALLEIDHTWFLSRVLDTLAEMHFAQGNNEHAARLFGAAAAARETVGASVFGFYRDEYERLMSAARERLGEDSFKKLWTEGRGLTLHQAVDYALAS